MTNILKKKLIFCFSIISNLDVVGFFYFCYFIELLSLFHLIWVVWLILFIKVFWIWTRMEYSQGAIKYGRLAEFLPGKPDFHRKFGLFWPILANNLKENSVRLTESINFSQEILISCFALPGSRKNYSALGTILGETETIKGGTDTIKWVYYKY